MSLELVKKLDTRWATAFPKRITRKQKEQFLEELERELQERGFVPQRTTVKALLTSRLLITGCEQPQVIFMAHYDTATVMPFWLSWLYRLLGHTRQILATVVLLVLLLAVYWLVLYT